MTAELVVDLLKYSLSTGALLVAPVLMVSMLVGVLVGALQAATQVSEPTLTFVPKVTAVGVLLALMMPWGLGKMVEVFQQVLEQAARVGP